MFSQNNEAEDLLIITEKIILSIIINFVFIFFVFYFSGYINLPKLQRIREDVQIIKKMI